MPALLAMTGRVLPASFSRASLLKAPLTLKEPVFCRFSLFRNRSHPLMAENVFELVTFTLWILPCKRFAAASTSLLFI